MAPDAPFRVIRPLGRGGMAAVFEVQLPGDPRRLAAKVLSASSPAARERFRREGEALAQLRHPNVVTVHGSGELPDGKPYLLLELVEGRTLGDRLTLEGALPVPEALRIASAVAGGLAAAHARGIVHRDVKPANVLLDGDGGVRLTDFGIALAVDQERLTRSGHWAGTIFYMAPEQLSTSAELGPGVDVYALGVLLFELLTGRLPFEGDDLHQLRVHIASCEPPPVRELRADVPPPVAAIVARCLEKSPALRHQDAADLQRDLDALAAGRRPVTSASAVALGLRRVLRRRGGRAGLGVGVVLVLIAGAAAVRTVASGADRERELRGVTAEVDGLARELDRRAATASRAAAALARGETAHASAVAEGDLDGAARLRSSLAALVSARDRAVAREATSALQQGAATPSAAALADAVAAWSRLARADEPELAGARAWTSLTAGRPEAGAARDPWLRAWSAARAGDARAALAAATSPGLRAEVALALGALDDVRPQGSGPDAALLRARLELSRAGGAAAPTYAALQALCALARADAPASTRALASLALGDAALTLGWDATAADALAAAHAQLGPDPPVAAVRWPVLGERALLHPATAALLGEAQARAWLHDGEAALVAARAAGERAALDDPRALLAARLLEAEALDLLDDPVAAQAALALASRLTGAAGHVAAVAARAAARRGEPSTAAPTAAADARAVDALARGWAELVAACSGPHAHVHGSDAKLAAVRRARRSFRLGLGGGVTDPTAWVGLGITHRALDDVMSASVCEERAVRRGAGETWERLALATMLYVEESDEESFPMRALQAAATQSARPLDRALDLVAAVRWVNVFGRAGQGLLGGGPLLDRLGQLATTLPVQHELVVAAEEQLLAMPGLDPALRARATARLTERRATLERVAALREHARRAMNADLQHAGNMAELLRLDPATGSSYRNYYNGYGQFAPGGFDAQALAFEVDPLMTMNELTVEADRLVRAQAGALGQVLHGAALTDWASRDELMSVERDEDVRRALAVVHALALGEAVDLSTRLAGLEAAQRYARRRPQQLGAWLLLGRVRLELGDHRGALEPLGFAARMPDPFGDLPAGWRLVAIVHTAQAWAALGEWDASARALELAGRLGWRQADAARRQRWFRLDEGRGQVAPPVEQALARIEQLPR